jgi:hypothetical protein
MRQIRTPSTAPQTIGETADDRRTEISCRGSPAVCPRKSFGGIVNVWRLSTSVSRRFSRSNVIRNRPACNTLWSDRALHLGWAREHIVVVDDDLGRSGATIEGRLSFQRLVAEVGLGRVGLVLGVEMSRLARSNRDWHQLPIAQDGTNAAELAVGHKFRLGQTVVFSPGASEVLNIASRCEITRLMPMDGAEYQYDIRVDPMVCSAEPGNISFDQ